ncbi:hypothetical protein E3N88_09866 [Mikania micrantha]|uniref:Uncharacterized protein n=1 Tax=Mikania micrantha TaxID=192012 RepID=A0A5N6PK99_9ASTR|nr:hypothetical protein E3N88_09866 [Mikania micrantha]
MKTSTRSELIDDAIEEIYEKPYESDLETIGDFISPHDEILIDKFDLPPTEAEVKLGYISGKKEDKPGYESEKEDEAYQRLIKSKKSACSVLEEVRDDDNDEKLIFQASCPISWSQAHRLAACTQARRTARIRQPDIFFRDPRASPGSLTRPGAYRPRVISPVFRQKLRFAIPNNP